ncbi:MAG: hypothetical protein KIT84_00575 [Labilithrix sp.]|nr:hypothetical protein [Labilithrix sp.]MCW5809478.1 hypothetical protein [Labilithrix sp.]
MSEAPKKNATKKSGTSKGTSARTVSVRDVAAHANHLHEVIAIIRAASVEYISRFAGVGHALPELLLQRDGSGARPATVDAIVDVGTVLEGVARELEARALAMLGTRVESAEVVDRDRPATAFGADRVVHRDLLDSPLRPAFERKSSAS